MRKPVFNSIILNAGFFLSGRNDIDVAFAFITSTGIQMDYLVWRKLPRSKIEKFSKLADIVLKEKVELAQAMGLNLLT